MVAFREVALPGGGVQVELCVEGQSVATAIATAEALEDRDVRALVERSLEERFEETVARIRLTALVRAGARVTSRYLQWRADRLVVGVVWYDEATKKTGPEHIDPVIRSAMRQAVARANRGPLRLLVDALHAMSA
jgi:hypothetical protein